MFLPLRFGRQVVGPTFQTAMASPRPAVGQAWIDSAHVNGVAWISDFVKTIHGRWSVIGWFVQATDDSVAAPRE